MIRYSMSQVETLTGINAHTLRVWERRYNFLRPMRTKTNIRYYSDLQLRKLLNIGILVRNGYRISVVDKMTESKIHELVTEFLSVDSGENHDLINGLVISMLEMNESAFDKIYQTSIAKSGFVSTITDLIYPFLNLVGGLWTTNKAIPAQEHFISNLIRHKIIFEIEALPNPKENSPRILLFLLEGEDHEIGLLLAYYIAKSSGWQVFYLGQKVPLGDVKNTANIVKPDALMSLFIVPRPNKTEFFISTLVENTNIPLLYSGNPRNFESKIDLDLAFYIKKPTDLTFQLEKIKEFSSSKSNASS